MGRDLGGVQEEVGENLGVKWVRLQVAVSINGNDRGLEVQTGIAVED